MSVICFDIDNTICQSCEGVAYEDLEPIQDMINLVNDLYEKGHTIYLYTGRHMLSEKVTRGWLQRHGVRVHNVFYGKPVADLYVDDNALRFNGDVSHTVKNVNKIITHKE